jgi:uncharacterized repeat protein (TIGR02543 family)
MNLLRASSLGKIAVIFPALLFAASLGFGQTNTVQILPFSNYGYVNPNYSGQALTIGKSYTMTAYAKSGFGFNGWTGSQTNSKTKLTFTATTNSQTFIANFKDKQKPSLAITAPANNSVLTNPGVINPAVIVVGTASDNDLVTNVYCNMNSLGWVPAATGNGWKNWWATLPLTPGTNSVQAYAVDRSGNISATTKLKLIYSTAPLTLSGVTLTVTNLNLVAGFMGYGTNSTFSNGTFSDGTGVGTYTYKKTGPLTGKLSLHYTAPPSVVTNDTIVLEFTEVTSDGTSGAFLDTGDNFTVTTADTLALPSLAGSNIRFVFDDGTDQSDFIFLSQPTVASNGNTNMFVTSNPFNIPLLTDYPGNIGDRVKVTLNHLKNYSGTWVSNSPVAVVGTVVDIPTTTTNTVTVLFDVTSYNSKSDIYSLMTNTPLNILTFYYTNYVAGNLATNGTGTFVYTNYSPIGSLLKLNRDNTNEFYILTFTDSSPAGTFYSENYAVGGGLPATNSGTFLIVATPQIIVPPKDSPATNGQTVAFSVTASGSKPLGYQWQFRVTGTNAWADLANGSNAWGSVVSGSTTTNLTISAATTNDIGYYQVIVTNAFGSVTSSVAALTITLIPVITSQPGNATFNTNTTASFSVAAIGYQPLSYLWYSGTNQLVNGSYFTNGSDNAQSLINSTNLTIQGISSTNFSAGFQVIISNDFGSVTSRVATLKFSTSSGITPGQ